MNISHELDNPDPAGRDLTLYRTRAYRFTNDLRHYVLAEELEERHIRGLRPPPRLRKYVEACLDSIRTSGRLPEFDPAVAETAGINIDTELGAREPHRRPAATAEPDQIVAIVGAPRSGTSHLYNLLAYHSTFAYFTTVSCWAWPTRNLTRPGRRPFTDLGDQVFAVDNKNTRLLPGVVMPYEAEDVYSRALPTYRHIARHRYELHSPQLGDVEILTRTASAHLEHFGIKTLLTKSPFNSLRIPLLEHVWGPKTRYLHIIRDQDETAHSMRRNHFEFQTADIALSAEDAWVYFNDKVQRDLPPDRHLTVNHADLQHSPEPTLNAILRWLAGPA